MEPLGDAFGPPEGKHGSSTSIQADFLDGYVIADEYRMTNQTGEVIVHGMNFRTYSVERKTWVIRWLSATGSFWLELGPEELGGVRVSPKTITFNFVDAFAPDAAKEAERIGIQSQPTLTRVTFSHISESHFTWTGERSLDQGKTWAEFIVVEGHRTE